MQIELYIEGNKKTFTAPFVPMLAKRKYLEIEAKAEKRNEKLSAQEQIEEDNEYLSILTDVVFKNQFTLDQLLEGQSKRYIDEKLIEAVFDVKPKSKKEVEEGNQKGE
jgi:hypothetical protein